MTKAGTRTVSLVLALMVGPGCQLYHNAAHNLVNAPAEVVDRACYRARLRKQAKAELESIGAAKPRHAGEAYRDGFVDGYADFLEFGGTGEPPPIPPPRYRRFKDLTPEGQAEMADWFEGFRHGAAVARDQSAGRAELTVPVQGGVDAAIPVRVEAPVPEPLPMPRPLSDFGREP
jgi:hypothetical protein